MSKESIGTKDVITLMSERTGFSKKDCKASLDATLEIISDQITKGGDVTLTKFGSFKCVDKEARTGTCGLNGSEYKTPAKRVMKFKTSNALNASFPPPKKSKGKKVKK